MLWLFKVAVIIFHTSLKPQNSWTSRHDTLMRLANLESDDLFTSNGFFKIRNKFSRKKFPYFPQFLAKSSCLP